MGLMLQISPRTSLLRPHWGPLPYLGQGAAALLCLGPLKQKMGVQGGTLHWGKPAWYWELGPGRAVFSGASG